MYRPGRHIHKRGEQIRITKAVKEVLQEPNQQTNMDPMVGPTSKGVVAGRPHWASFSYRNEERYLTSEVVMPPILHACFALLQHHSFGKLRADGWMDGWMDGCQVGPLASTKASCCCPTLSNGCQASVLAQRTNERTGMEWNVCIEFVVKTRYEAVVDRELTAGR